MRAMLGEWEKMANGLGGEVLKSGEFAKTMHGASTAAMNAQGALKQVMERGLAAANMPSKSELEDISARLARVEGALFRIEALLTEGRPPPAAAIAKPRPTRDRKPPASA